MRVLLLNLQAPLMSFGVPQVDHIGNTGRFPTISLIAGLCGNALGYSHGDHERLQSLQDRIRLASVLVQEGREVEDYQTVDLGQEHLRHPAWTTRGRPEHRDGGPDAKYGTHIRLRRYRAGAKVLAAITLSPAESEPNIEQVAEALERPFRPLFLGRKNCLPADRIMFGLLPQAESLTEALSRAPAAFPDRWERAFGALDSRELPAEWPVARESALSADERIRAQRVVDQRDWRNQLHGGERVVMRGPLELVPVENPEGAKS